jgi:phosphocarrier protein HPr
MFGGFPHVFVSMIVMGLPPKVGKMALPSTGTRLQFFAIAAALSRLCWRLDSSLLEMRLTMQERELTILNRLGLHARAAAKLVTLSSRYASSVVLVANGRRADARHFIAVLLLSAGMGAQVSVRVSGPDEVEAITAVTRLISGGFGEGSYAR